MDLYDVAKYEGETEKRGQHFICWRFTRGLEKDLNPRFMGKIRENVATSFYARHVYACQLENLEDGTIILYYVNKGSPWFDRLEVAEKRMSTQENDHLHLAKVEMPSTKWQFLAFFSIDGKVVLDQAPLLGTGPIPEWLRNLAQGGHWMTAQEMCRDNLCIWHCIAAHQGGRADHCTQKARELAKGFSNLRKLKEISQKRRSIS